MTDEAIYFKLSMNKISHIFLCVIDDFLKMEDYFLDEASRNSRASAFQSSSSS